MTDEKFLSHCRTIINVDRQHWKLPVGITNIGITAKRLDEDGMRFGVQCTVTQGVKNPEELFISFYINKGRTYHCYIINMNTLAERQECWL